MPLSKHNVEQMARGHLMYELAKRGYLVQLTDSRFPAVDMLVVSPSGKHFGIDVKGQKKKYFWRLTRKEPNLELFYAFILVPEKGTPKVFIMDSETVMKEWDQYKKKAIEERGAPEENIWGFNWTTPYPYQDKYDLLPG